MFSLLFCPHYCVGRKEGIGRQGGDPLIICVGEFCASREAEGRGKLGGTTMSIGHGKGEM